MGTAYEGLGHGLLEKLESLTIAGSSTSPPRIDQVPISFLNHATFELSSDQAEKRRVRPEHPEYGHGKDKAVKQVPKVSGNKSKDCRQPRRYAIRLATSGDQKDKLNVHLQSPERTEILREESSSPTESKMNNPMIYSAPIIYDRPRILTPQVPPLAQASSRRASLKYRNFKDQISPRRPVPHASYIAQASRPPKMMPTRQPLLLVSDLNGTLFARYGKNSFETRPGLPSFLAPFFGPEPVKHRFMVWTSMTPDRTINLTNKLLTPAERKDTVAIWGRDKLNLTATQYAEDVLVYKNLDWIWRDPHIQATHPFAAQGGRWNQTNTLLIDDTVHKAAAQPFNLVNVPELTHEQVLQEEDGPHMPVLRQLAWYLEEASYHEDVSAFMKTKPFAAHGLWQRDPDHHDLRSKGLPCPCCVVFYKAA